MEKMSQNFRMVLWVAFTAVVATIGCGKLKSGGGFRSVTVGNSEYYAAYGFDADDQLAFVIFTNFSQDGTTGSGGSSWSGKITTPDGKTVEYVKSQGGLKINEQQFKFTDGKVFLVSNNQDGLAVSQIDVKTKAGSYKDEIDRLKDSAELKEFFGK